jgi:hypothetical protein
MFKSKILAGFVGISLILATAGAAFANVNAGTAGGSRGSTNNCANILANQQAFDPAQVRSCIR